MGILDVHADELQTAGRNALRVPVPQPTPKFSMWNTVTAAPRGVATGAAETGGFWADITGAFGQALATTEASGGGMFAGMTPRERTDMEQARAKVVEGGLDFSSEAGGILRGGASIYRPDPQTASTAEQMVFGLARGMSKAVGYGMAAGPIAGPVLFGADEALTAADELRQQGVDLATRTKAGAVIGGVSAAGLALPVAPTVAAGQLTMSTIGKGAALAAIGGPISFVGQQAATRYILANAGYEKISDQYDPLDPVGLTLATLIPAGFGAWALRGAVRGARRGQATHEAEGAEPARVEPIPQEHVDAARVHLMAEEQQRASLAPAQDLRAAEADIAAQSRAADQIAAGERVDVLREAGELPPDARLLEMARGVQEALRPELEAVVAREMALPVPEPVARAEPEAAPAAQPAEVPPVQQVVRNVVDQIRAEIEAFTGQPVQKAEPKAEAPNPQQARLQQLEETNPDMLVRVDGMEQPVPLREFMKQVKEQAKRETDDAQLVQVAAECFLRTA